MDNPQAIATVLAALIAAAASIIAALLSRRSANESSATRRALQIRQARLDERDLIMQSGGFAIPVENDAMWRDYVAHMGVLGVSDQSAAGARKSASERVAAQIPRLPPDLAGKPLG